MKLAKPYLFWYHLTFYFAQKLQNFYISITVKSRFLFFEDSMHIYLQIMSVSDEINKEIKCVFLYYQITYSEIAFVLFHAFFFFFLTPNILLTQLCFGHHIKWNLIKIKCYFPSFRYCWIIRKTRYSLICSLFTVE